VRHDLRPDLDQLLVERGQRPVLYGPLGRHQLPQEVPLVLRQGEQLSPRRHPAANTSTSLNSAASIPPCEVRSVALPMSTAPKALRTSVVGAPRRLLGKHSVQRIQITPNTQNIPSAYNYPVDKHVRWRLCKDGPAMARKASPLAHPFAVMSDDVGPFAPRDVRPRRTFSSARVPPHRRTGNERGRPTESSWMAWIGF
jgi:hypothetical protein